MNDSFLISQVLAGNRNAFRLIVVRYQRPVFGFLRGFGLPPAVGEEIAQEAFLRAYRGLSGFDGARASFQSWLFTIARNLALHEKARASRRHETAVDDLDQLVVPAFMGDGATAAAASADGALESRDRRGRLGRALDHLPPLLRSSLVLAYVRELSLQDIAAIERCPVGTVKSRIFRGKQLLRAALAETES
jgi:RNA polymerase sigma-70 factor (ECF subfamily)